MTPEQQRKMLECAAEACGIEYLVRNVNTGRLGISEWNPLTNHADCAVMCAELGIGTRYFIRGGRVECFMDYDSIEAGYFKDHDNSRLKAWMYAATIVAAKIGGFEE